MKVSTERSGDGAAEGGGRSPERSEPISPLSKGSQSVQVRSRAPILSRCRLAAMAAGLHPASTGVQVPPPRPLPGSSTVERPPVKRRDVGANPTPAAIFVGETASDVTCPTCRHCSEHHRGRRPNFARVPFGNGALNGRSSSEQGPEDRKDNDMIAVALVVAWFAVVGLVLIARADYGRRPLTR